MPPGTAKKKDNYFNVEGKKGRKFFFVFAWVFFRDQIIGNWDKLIVSYQCCGCCSSHPFRYVLRFTMLRTARDHQKKKKSRRKLEALSSKGWYHGVAALFCAIRHPSAPLHQRPPVPPKLSSYHIPIMCNPFDSRTSFDPHRQITPDWGRGQGWCRAKPAICIVYLVHQTHRTTFESLFVVI